jgi:hypothetical protein
VYRSRRRHPAVTRLSDSPDVPHDAHAKGARIERQTQESTSMNKHLIAAALAASALIAGPARATDVALAADGSWNEFDVDSMSAADFGNEWIDFADGSPLSFTFTVAAGSIGTLTVVDAGFAGDTFAITNFGAALGATSSVEPGTTDGPLEFDFDAALANPAYSHGVFTLGAGTYSISGSLLQSVFDTAAGADLDATNGAVRLTISTIPEPSSTTLLLGGLAVAALAARRRKPAHSI